MTLREIMIDLMFQSRQIATRYLNIENSTTPPFNFRYFKYLPWEHDRFYENYYHNLEKDTAYRSSLPYLTELLNDIAEDDIKVIFLDDRGRDYSWDDIDTTIDGKGYCLFGIPEYYSDILIPYYVYAYYWAEEICGEHRDVAIGYLSDEEIIPSKKLMKMFAIKDKIIHEHGESFTTPHFRIRTNLWMIEEYLGIK